MRRFALLLLVGVVVVIAVIFITTAIGSDQWGIAHIGTLESADGSAIEPDAYNVQFSLYKKITGGEPVWGNTVSVDVDELGNYSVYLSPIDNEFILADPADPEDTGERYLEVAAEGFKESERALVVALPYPMSTEVAVANRVSKDAWEPEDSTGEGKKKSAAAEAYDIYNTSQISEMKHQLSELEGTVGRLEKEMQLMKEEIESINP